MKLQATVLKSFPSKYRSIDRGKDVRERVNLVLLPATQCLRLALLHPLRDKDGYSGRMHTVEVEQDIIVRNSQIAFLYVIMLFNRDYVLKESRLYVVPGLVELARRAS